MEKINYQKILDKMLEEIERSGEKKKLLLHACCAPCSSYVLEYLSKYFDITLYFYNPNISPEGEYDFRAEELKRLVLEMPLPKNINVITEVYNSDEFYNKIAGHENDPEGGARCRECYTLRLEQSAKYARDNRFDFFTTTLSISPYKNSRWLNEIGESLSGKYGVAYLTSDFKKRNGYKRSCELSLEYGLYRQDYCGCEFSKNNKNNHTNKSEKTN